VRAKKPYKKKSKRVGRGIGSGRGKTSTRGHKGQRSRSGASLKPGFEGGQNPLYRRLPKRGFNRKRFEKNLAIVNLSQIETLGEPVVTPEILMARGVVKKQPWGVKVLGNGELSSSVTIKAHAFSASAKEKIEKAGGQAVALQLHQ